MCCYNMLHGRSTDGVLERGVTKDAAFFFQVHRNTIGKIWRATNTKLADHLSNHPDGLNEFLSCEKNFENDNNKKTGRPRKWERVELRKAVKVVPLGQRKDWRSIAAAVGVPKSTLHDMSKKEKIFKRRRSNLKPVLTDENKVARMCFALDEITQTNSGDNVYKSMYDRVHVDEKWFRITKDGESFILLDSDEDEEEEGEEEPTRRCSHKSHITKVMFLCAQARPRHDPATNQWWDGKIGIWPIGEWAPAQRSSTNREAGTIVWHDHLVTKEVYRNILLYKVFPAIESKWPRGQWNDPNFKVRVQHDGASAHRLENDGLYLLQLGNYLGKILIYLQAANSPDTNLNDLGFFRALQSMSWKKDAADVTELINNVMRTYMDYDSKRINHCFLTLMSILNQIIDHGGDNNYKIPHMGKLALERVGQLPVTLPVTDTALQYLD